MRGKIKKRKGKAQKGNSQRKDVSIDTETT
jgi:hypothetical protein